MKKDCRGRMLKAASDNLRVCKVGAEMSASLMHRERRNSGGGQDERQAFTLKQRHLSVDLILLSAYMNLSLHIDHAVKAYIEHTNVVIQGDGALNVSYLMQPFEQLTQNAQLAQQAMLQAMQNGGSAVAGAAEVKEEETKGKGKRKKRAYKPRDPNAPKRPLTAYFRYLQEQRPLLAVEMAEAHNGVPQKPGDLSKEATIRWNKLTHDEQQPYRDAYGEAVKGYTIEAAKYKALGGNVSPAADTTEVDATHDGGEEDAPGEEVDQVNAKPAKVVDAEDDEDESSSDDSSDDEEEEEEEVPAPPPPPPTKATPKSEKKKGKQPAVAPTPQFSSINPELTAPAPATNSASPNRKRKALGPAAEAPAEPPAAGTAPAPKKRGRKSNAEKAAAAADPPAPAQPPTPAPVAQMQTSPAAPAVAEPAKKKRKRKGEDA
ncbi:hypothetical protein B0A55_03274 [Friedmanniomyces simplex]|uniref:HMG box domain-containing protein n=1 Tax=Friedmanniomyces simplex TaxID=329884 RepID=A0A4U0XRQ0_9PEZI|nr:hypothetical protein B0A55_03274 [Friedmanniomyces simplex]